MTRTDLGFLLPIGLIILDGIAEDSMLAGSLARGLMLWLTVFIQRLSVRCEVGCYRGM